MGTFYAPISLSNPRHSDLAAVETPALVDTGSMYTCIPEHIAIQLCLDRVHDREVTLANGSKRLCPYVGPLYLRFEKRGCFTGALVLGDEVLLGAIAMEDMDLVVSPLARKLGPNPLNPNIPHALAK